MNWIKITQGTELPEFEVLAINFAEGTYGYKEKLLGYLNWSNVLYEGKPSVMCSANYEELMNCTHYCIIEEPLI